MTRAELAFAAACALAALAPLYPRGRAQPVAAPQPWAAVVEHSWQRTALSARDVSSGPLGIARFQKGERRLLVRQLREPTRSLHSAADCLRAEGWEVQRTAAALADTRGAGVWVATRAGARIHVEGAEQLLTGRRAGELVAQELTDAHRSLGEITGEVSSDELLGHIFASFCIGK
mgnify:CR=1 FL=1